MRCVCSWFLLLLSVTPLAAQSPGFATQTVHATYRLENAATNGSAFVLRRQEEEEHAELLLVTAAHAFQKMSGEQATLVLRRQDADGSWHAEPKEIRIRQRDKPLWQQHPELDVAVLPLPWEQSQLDSLPLEALATAETWQALHIEPGALIRSVGFPHASQFKPSPAAFPLTRLGCIASYPLLPYQQHRTFLADYNTFEGDSGGPVYITAEGKSKILGLVHAQHFIDERYKLVYQEGMIRKRMGLAIVVHSQAILETIELLSESD